MSALVMFEKALNDLARRRISGCNLIGRQNLFLCA